MCLEARKGYLAGKQMRHGCAFHGPQENPDDLVRFLIDSLLAEHQPAVGAEVELAFARLGQSSCAKKLVSINWDAWSETGVAVKALQR